jgi:NAD(P)-dependent dehydrogenase (short-subunit alcohol dehydrogenase family)
MAVFAPRSTALITGSGGGIGFAVAQLCLKHKMRVVVADNSSESLSKAKSALSPAEDVETYQIDVSDLGAWKGLKSHVESKFGQVDLLHLNAGTSMKGTWGDDEFFQKVCKLFLIYAGSFITRAVDTINQFVRHHQRAEYVCPCVSEPFSFSSTIGDCHHGIEARHHEPAWQRSVQRVKIRRQDYCGASGF